jgi:hypothetical protein
LIKIRKDDKGKNKKSPGKKNIPRLSIKVDCWINI